MPRRLTTDSYAILGCLALRDYSAYELNKSMRTSGVRYAWPSTRTRVYDEPKNLVHNGLATVRIEATGNRKRSMYSITDAGREALAEWLEEPGATPRSENEALLKVFLAGHGSREALETQVNAIQASVEADYETLIEIITDLSEKPPTVAYHERAHLSDLLLVDAVGRLEQTTGWLTWARSQIETWADTTTDAEKRQTARDNLSDLLARAQANLRAVRDRSRDRTC